MNPETVKFLFMGSALLSAVLLGIILIPIVLILPRFIGIWGIQIAQPLADLISFLISVPMTMGVIREMNTGVREETSACTF